MWRNMYLCGTVTSWVQRARSQTEPTRWRQKAAARALVAGVRVKFLSIERGKKSNSWRVPSRRASQDGGQEYLSAHTIVALQSSKH